ncbi:ATP-dependent RNA helicase HrpA [Saccharophagus degradans]|uniref:ATP-dependent RNA helicase HrpA n=1 Tax=Saccharophagus degradans TaxID=86304 RepID=UPI002477E54E|nr:ATP-dependent RNA helicase HrpA [Saccharophagus degradans]WGO97455.1 ATP-dependent RNA helicase HrpA [Saccharophagus degradans]
MAQQQVQDLPTFNANNVCAWHAKKLTSLREKIIARIKREQPVDKLVEQLANDIEQAQAVLAARKAAVPAISFPEQLPISEKRADIAELIANNQVVILAGETGSGKTTQLPKICLELGRGIRGLIGHTQPRRIAARTVADRIAQELQVPLGDAVGYQVRFTDHVTDSTLIKLMTDGILLAEIQQDPLLLKYDTLIIDEAHERSLNIDFLLGYLKQILAKRPDLKLIVTSATIDLDRFSKHFNNAPVIEVSGRTYPVEVLYRPWQDEFEDLTQAIVNAVEEIQAISKGRGGDVLVFLSGERDIREASHALKKANLPHWEIVPLYARLSLEEQNRVFSPHKGRRVVLATNVAETSLTVPGIRYVIDPGTARIKRYSLRTKVERLPVENISQASANQRKGRCGRVSEGVCIRLYDREDFESRPEFTDPEILRSNLAAVILQMLQMRIGDVRKFPFVDKPDNRLINDGFKLLEELGAVDKSNRVTKLGRDLQQLPLDPKFGRMIVAAAEQGCLRELLIIVSGLTIQDPRERPADKQQAADEKHRRFWDEKSDFLSLVNLWHYVEEQRQELSQNQLRKLCQKEFLNFMRLREWRELHHQLRVTIKKMGFKENQDPASYDVVHEALLTGLLSNMGNKNEEPDARDYRGTRNRKFMIFPGSALRKKRPKWLFAAEMIETSQVYAHCVAQMEPEWALKSGAHLLKYNYFEPHYDKRAGQVKAFVRISLFGLVLIEKKRVGYSKIDPAEAREVFIRAALVEGQYRGKGAFFNKNNALIAEVEDLEAKSRRKDIMVDDEVLFHFYNEIIPSDICNLAGFEHWRKKLEETQPDALLLSRDLLMLHGAEGVTEAQFPDQLDFDGVTLPVSYHFEPGHPQDGVSVKVPVTLLHMLSDLYLPWLVPGLLRDKCIALVKALPKAKRKKVVPVPQFVDRAMARMTRSKASLTEALTRELKRLADIELTEDDWDESALEPFYHMNVIVVDAAGKPLDQGRDLNALRERYRGHVQESLQSAGSSFEQTELTGWTFESLPETVDLDKGGVTVRGFPALQDDTSSVSLRVLDNPAEAYQASLAGLARLACLQLGQSVRYLQKQLLKGKDIGLTMVDLGKRDQVVDDILMAAVYRACFLDKPFPRTATEFKQCVDAGAGELVSIAQEYETLLLDILKYVVAIKKAMKSNKSAFALALAFGDINQQLAQLIYKGFMFATPVQWLKQYPRYLNAIEVRIEKAAQNPQKDRVAIAELTGLWQKHQDRLLKEGSHSYIQNTAWQEYRWMLEELRVSLFAQTLKTLMPVSAKRLNKQWQLSEQ